MASQSSRASRWSIALIEVLLPGLLAFPARSAEFPGAAGSADGGMLDVAGMPFNDAGEIGVAGQRGIDVHLEVVLNGSARGLVHFGDREGELWASAATLRRLGFILPEDVVGPIRLKGLPDVQVRYDVARQAVAIEAPLSLLALPTTMLSTPGVVAQRASASPGLLVNYDLYGTQAQGGLSTLNAFTELRAFSGASVLSNTSLSQAIHGDQGHSRTVRLDTTWSTSDPERMLTLRVGDTLTAALPWSRATRIGGIQLSSDFALQPYRVTAPLPVLMGSATLPSDVELYVNGMRQYSGQVPAGPFQLNTQPNINGAGNAQVVLTDAFGRATTLNFSLYDSHRLLQEGLSDWSVDLGAVRQNYGLDGFDYANTPAASGTWRHGLTNRFTFEAHGEVTTGLALAGIGAAGVLGQAGVLSGAIARSQRRGQDGSLLNLGYNWRNDRFNVGVDATATRGNYLDVASLYGTAPPRGTGRALVGYSTRNLGSFGLNYLYLRYPAQAASRYAGAYWFKSLGRTVSLSMSANQNLDDRRQRNLFLSLTWALDGRTTLGAGVQQDSGRTAYYADAQRPAPTEGGLGWRAALREGDGQTDGQAELNFLGRYGRVAAGVGSLGAARYGYASATGAVVLIGGQAFAARRIDNAFAVVSTDGVPGVPVTLENRPIGTTDEHGMLLVLPLNAYQNNQIAIDPMQLPDDLKIDRVRALATPSGGAGTLVRFGLTPVRAATLVLVDEAGAPLPPGSLARVNAQPGEPAMVGFDGMVYLDTLADSRNVLEVETPAGLCRVDFEYRKEGKGIPQLGPLPCRKERVS